MTDKIDNSREILGNRLKDIADKVTGMDNLHVLIIDAEYYLIQNQLEEKAHLGEYTVKVSSSAIMEHISKEVQFVNKIPKLTEEEKFKIINYYLKEFAQKENLQLKIVENKNTDESRYTYYFSWKYLY